MKTQHYSVNKAESKWDMNTLVPRKTQSVKDINLDDYRIVQYQLGLSLFCAKHILWKHFDWVDLISESAHPIKKTKAYTFIAYRNSKATILICEKIISNN